MTTWTEQRKKVQKHFAFIKYQSQPEMDQTSTQIPQPIGPPQPSVQRIKMALHPTVKAVSFDELAESYGAINFQDALADYIAQVNHPNLLGNALRA